MFEWSERMFGRYAISNTKTYRVHKLIMSDSKSIFNYTDNQKPNRFLIFFFLNTTLTISVPPWTKSRNDYRLVLEKKKDKEILIFYLKLSGVTLSISFNISLTLSSNDSKDSIYPPNLSKSLNKFKSDNSLNLGKSCLPVNPSLFEISL